jgi:hypothetical protein
MIASDHRFQDVSAAVIIQWYRFQLGRVPRWPGPGQVHRHKQLALTAWGRSSEPWEDLNGWGNRPRSSDLAKLNVILCFVETLPGEQGELSLCSSALQAWIPVARVEKKGGMTKTHSTIRLRRSLGPATADNKWLRLCSCDDSGLTSTTPPTKLPRWG